MEFGGLIIAIVLSISFMHSEVSSSAASNPESMLMRYLLDKLPEQSDKFHPRPIDDPQIPVEVAFKITFVQILDFDQKKQKLTMQTWKRLDWRDKALTWNPADFGGINNIRISPKLIWTPDIMLYNTYGDPKRAVDDFNVIVYHTGDIMSVPAVIYESPCQVDLYNFPFDTQVCRLKFGSWTYSVDQLNITINDSAKFDLSEYIHNLEWELIDIGVTEESTVYSCCKEEYATVTYMLYLKRSAAYHVRTILLPVLVLSIMAVFMFCIPPQRPDRTGLGLSLFTGFMLLLLLVVGISPPSAESRLSTYLSACVGIVTSAIVVSIALISLSTMKGKVPRCLHVVFLKCLHKVLFPLTNVQNKADYDPKPANMSEWLGLVNVLDRIMFVVYSIILIVCILLYFPFPQ